MPCRFVTFEEDSAVESVFAAGNMQELAGKRVEIKTATPRGSGSFSGRSSIISGQFCTSPEPFFILLTHCRTVQNEAMFDMLALEIIIILASDSLLKVNPRGWFNITDFVLVVWMHELAILPVFI